MQGKERFAGNSGNALFLYYSTILDLIVLARFFNV